MKPAQTIPRFIAYGIAAMALALSNSVLADQSGSTGQVMFSGRATVLDATVLGFW